jgi:hypothetical protein
LDDEEWRFGLGGREGFKERHFLEELGDEHKHVQIEGNRCGDSVATSPGTGEITSVKSDERNPERDEGKDSEHMRRQELVKRKEKAGDAGKNGGYEEKKVPAVRERAAEKA